MVSSDSKAVRQTLQWQQLLPPAPYIVGGTLIAILPLLVHPYLQSLIAKVLIFGIFAMSLDIIYGYSGLWSFGHAAFFGVGGYTVGKLMVDYGVKSFWIGAPCGVLMAGLMAAIIGFIALRTAGIYFLLLTFALGQMTYAIAWKWKWLSTGGIHGIPAISRPDIGIPGFTWSTTSFCYFVIAIFFVCLFLLYRFVESPFGHALKGIRENEQRMRSLGFNTWAYKYVAFVVAGVFAGVAGVLFAYHNGIIVPAHLSVSTSALAMLMVIIGGAGTLFGGVLGAALVLLVEHYASIFTPERWPSILGIFFVAAGMYVRGGIGIHIVAWCNDLQRRWKSYESRV